MKGSHDPTHDFRRALVIGLDGGGDPKKLLRLMGYTAADIDQHYPIAEAWAKERVAMRTAA